MSMTLQDVLRDYVTRHGTQGKTRLALNARVSVPLIEKVLKGHVPKPENIFGLAVAAGLNEAQANELVHASTGRLMAAEAKKATA